MTNIWAGEKPVESSNVLARLTTAVNNLSKNADELKKVIDNPDIAWTSEEQSRLKPITENYQTIKNTNTSIHEQLNTIDALLHHNQDVSDQLLLASRSQKEINNQLQTVDAHLNQYLIFLESLSKNTGELSEAQQQWQVKANQQVQELNELKRALSAELKVLDTAQQACTDLAPSVMQQLESLLINTPVETITIPQDVSFLQKAMGNILSTMTDLHKNLTQLVTHVRSVFSKLSDCIDTAVKLLDKTSDCLKQSEQLLAQYPSPALGMANTV